MKKYTYDINQDRNDFISIVRALDNTHYDNLERLFGSNGAMMVKSLAHKIFVQDVCNTLDIDFVTYMSDPEYFTDKYYEDCLQEEPNDDNN